MATKKKGLTREQAAELYTDLQRTMAKMLKNEAEYLANKGQAKAIGSGTSARTSRANPLDVLRASAANSRKSERNSGAALAVSMIIMCALAKMTFAALEISGIIEATPVEATVTHKELAHPPVVSPYSKEELQILKSLDARRAELEERNTRLDGREREISLKDREFAAKLTELRELTEKLNLEREKDDRKRDSQLEQLSNVYGSMNPEEAAKLIEQLDITIALSLIERMPEKRIGQILAAMTPERALNLTKMLSGKSK